MIEMNISIFIPFQLMIMEAYLPFLTFTLTSMSMGCGTCQPQYSKANFIHIPKMRCLTV